MALTTTRPDTRERWIKAAERAADKGIQVAQLQGSGQWIATSSKPGIAYELAVTGNVVHGCSCPAGLANDPVCCHRAAWLVSIGAITLGPKRCPSCTAGKIEELGVSGPIGWQHCSRCGGSGFLAA